MNYCRHKQQERLNMHYYHKMKHDKAWLDKEKERKRLVAKNWRKHNKNKQANYNKQWYDRNKEYFTAFHGKHYKCMPKWADREKIRAIYLEARNRGLEVDHIIPIKGDGVCGLHVDYNLQLLTREENIAKRNSY